MAKGKRQMKLGTVIKRAQKLNDGGDYISAIKEVRKQLGYNLYEAKSLVDYIKNDHETAWEDLAEGWCKVHKCSITVCVGRHGDDGDLSWEIGMIEEAKQEHRERNPEQYAERVMDDVEPAVPVHGCRDNCGLKDNCSNPWHVAARWIHADINNYHAFQKWLLERSNESVKEAGQGYQTFSD
jgi:hypothetical protein